MKQRLELPNVTLLTITSVNIEQSHLALLISSERIKFGAVKLFSPLVPRNMDPALTHVSIPAITRYWPAIESLMIG